jgi:hypothetical protein
MMSVLPSVALSGILAIVLVIAAMPSAALAAPPTNDNFAQATVIGALPFTDTLVSTEATSEPGEPFPCSGSFPQTVWYTFTPSTTGQYRASTSGSTVAAGLMVYRQTGTTFGSLSSVGCSLGLEPLVFSGVAGVTYYIQAVTLFFGGSGTLHMNLNAVVPPPNDDFASATRVTALPFNDSVDTTAATVEGGEPSLCTTSSDKTAWYVYTPTASGSVSATARGFFAANSVAAYTGDSLTGLTRIGCGSGQTLTFRVSAGTTYRFQVGSFGSQGGPMQFTLDVSPAPIAAFFYAPGNPSSVDTVQFFDQSHDPAQSGWSDVWSFGDGTTSSAAFPTHRYTTDGDYTARLSITTSDGRTASSTQTLHVATHDVAISRFNAPQNARPGQTREMTVGVSNARYPERVTVQLSKSNSSGGFDTVGSLTQSVSVGGKSSTTPFTFNYTFTADDAAVGKVTFMAVATLVDARDALPADNQAVTLATIVKR